MSAPEHIPDDRVEVLSPERLAGGRFSLYVAPDGRLVVALRVEGQERDVHFVIPKPLARLVARQAGIEDPVEAIRRWRDDQE